MAEQDNETDDRQETATGDEDQQESNGGGNGIGQTLADELRQVVRDAALEVLGPAARQATSSAAKYAVKKGPDLVRDNVMPAVDKAGGAGGLAKQVASKGGEALSKSGGVGGIAGKLMSKLGGRGGKKGVATGYGQGRRIMVQQVQYIPVDVKDVYRAWTQSDWPEYMHRVNTLDRQVEEDSARYAIGVKGLWFKKNFTAEVKEQVPFRFIVWSTTQGNIKNTGRVSFHGEGDDLTLMILNLDMAPSGLREKWVRGFRYHKRGIRSDFHRFSAWVQMRTQEELDDIEGWLGTIEGGKVTQTHEEYVEEHPEEQDRGDEPDSDSGPSDEEAEPEQVEDEEEESEGEGDEEEAAEGEYDEDQEPAGEEEQEEPEDEQEEPEGEYEEAEEPEDSEDEGEEEPEAAADEDAASDEEDERPARRRQSRQRRPRQEEQAADRPRRAQSRRREQPQGDADDSSETETRSSRRRRPAGQGSRG